MKFCRFRVAGKLRRSFKDALEIVILGATVGDRPFQPGDWAARLCGMMPVFGEDRHLSYSSILKHVLSGGVLCVVVNRELECIDPAVCWFLFSFARDNELSLRAGRKQARPEDPAPAPTLPAQV